MKAAVPSSCRPRSYAGPHAHRTHQYGAVGVHVISVPSSRAPFRAVGARFHLATIPCGNPWHGQCDAQRPEYSATVTQFHAPSQRQSSIQERNREPARRAKEVRRVTRGTYRSDPELLAGANEKKEP